MSRLADSLDCSIIMSSYSFVFVPGVFAVARLPADAAVPAWALEDEQFMSVTRTSDELSIVCGDRFIPADVRSEPGWSLIKLIGPFPFSQVGVLSSFARPLAAAGISLFAVSTFDTDYILVKHVDVAAAWNALVQAGHHHVSG